MRGRGRTSSRRDTGQHFLADRTLARRLVANAGVTSADLVLDIGAGTGALTRELAVRAGRVWAIEIDERLADRLRAEFVGDERVRVIAGDATTAALPGGPFRVVANVPFSSTTAILRRLLDDPAAPLERADLVVQWEAAIKRASPLPATVVGLSWAPWWELTVTRRIPAGAFRPPPRVDAGVLTITRRPNPLLGASERAAYLAVLRHAFARAGSPLRQALAGVVPSRRLGRLTSHLGIDRDARPIDLDVGRWTALFRATREHTR